VGLAIFAAMVALGVILAAGGDQGTRRVPAGHLTAVNAVSEGHGRRHAADAVSPRPNPRARRPRGASGRSNPL
jgi:hypothetical protein